MTSLLSFRRIVGSFRWKIFEISLIKIILFYCIITAAHYQHSTNFVDGTTVYSIEQFAGSGYCTTDSWNGTYSSMADFCSLYGVTADGSGNVYFADNSQMALVGKIDHQMSVISIYAGGGADFSDDSIAATTFSFGAVSSMWVDSSSSELYIVDQNYHQVKRVNMTTEMISTFAGSGFGGFVGDGGIPLVAQLNNPHSVVGDSMGNIYISDYGNSRIRKVSATSGLITTLAGGGILAVSNGLDSADVEISPQGMAMDTQGNLYFADSGHYAVYRLNTVSSLIYNFAGNGVQDDLGNGGAATSASLISPRYVAVDTSLNVFISDVGAMSIRKVNSSGIISTFIGSTNSPTITFTFSQLGSISIDSSQRLFMVDSYVIRIVDLSTGSPSASPSAMPSTIVPTNGLTLLPTLAPSFVPTSDPTIPSTVSPTQAPTFVPTSDPTLSPTWLPSTQPTVLPTIIPSPAPSTAPTTLEPSFTPSREPTSDPTSHPSSVPTKLPTPYPSPFPTAASTITPSVMPTALPSDSPTYVPSQFPAHSPTEIPSQLPSAAPSFLPTVSPSANPTPSPSFTPSAVPTACPSISPSFSPSAAPTIQPSTAPTEVPSFFPTNSPSTVPSVNPSTIPSSLPTSMPSAAPTSLPTTEPTNKPSNDPTGQPSRQPSTQPSNQPTTQPSQQPTRQPISGPSCQPSKQPVSQPTTQPTRQPSVLPSSQPTTSPTTKPTSRPSSKPTAVPTRAPAYPTSKPTTLTPTLAPSINPTTSPSYQPSIAPSANPTTQPTVVPTATPTVVPTIFPTISPSSAPTLMPSLGPTIVPTLSPTVCPTASPSAVPTQTPTVSPSRFPTAKPTGELKPTFPPSTMLPTPLPSKLPSAQPSSVPSVTPFANINLLSTTLSTSQVILNIEVGSNARFYALAVPVRSTNLNSISAMNILTSGKEVKQSTVTFDNLQPATSYFVVFAAVSSYGVVAASSWMERNRLNLTTLCCRTIKVSQSASVLVSGIDYQKLISVSVDNIPNADMQVVLSLFKQSGEQVPGIQLLPSILQLAPTDGSSSIYWVGLSRLEPGNYTLKALLIGNGAVDYTVSYQTSTLSGLSFLVQSADKPLPAPALTGATFANDGSFVKLVFSDNTDQGGSSSLFKCDTLLNFKCASRSTCVWIAASIIHVFVDTSSTGCAAPGDSISLALSAQIRAACPNSKCSSMQSWPTMDVAGVVTILSPATAISPTVVINVPNEIGSCTSLVIDVASSLGGGGRTWSNYSIVVSTDENNFEAQQELTSFLVSSFQVESPTSIPSALLPADYSYSFAITLCNFLGKCTTSSKTVIVRSSLVPIISIAGSTSRLMNRNGVLSLFGTGSLPICDGATKSSRDTLLYDWAVYSSPDKSLLPTLKSTSSNPSRFLLPPYSLSTNSLYTVTVTVTTSISKQQASSSVQVFVGQGSIVAAISGSKMRSMRKGESLTLDAASSYDEDVSTVDAASTLFYSWSCVQTQPVLSSTCDSIMTLSAVSSKLIITPSESIDTSDQDIGGQVSVTVYDSTRTRSATASVSVAILPALSAVISLSSNLVRVKMNPGDGLKLTGTISAPSELSSNVTWSLDAATTGLVDLKSVSLTPLVQTYAASSTSSATLSKRITYLALPSSVLPAGVTYTFSLTCTLASPGKTSSSSISIEVNKAPTPGILSISPISGEELSTMFVFSCSRWVDEDLPLTYVFGYLSSSGQQVMLRSRSETAYSSSMLPAGQKTSSSTKQVLVGISQVYDSYLASSYVDSEVEVKEKTVQLTAVDILSYVQNSSLSSSGGSVDEMKQATALVTYLLNKVDCSKAPNCTSLLRKSCSRTTNTCGACLSESYLGDSGDANTACYSPLSITTASGGVKLVDESKTCNSDCSGHGLCVYSSIVTGGVVGDCKLNQFDCKAYCICDEGYFGDSCSISAEELEMKRQARESVVNSLVSLAALQDVSQDSSESMISSLMECSQRKEELSAASMNSLLAVALFTLEETSSNSIVVSNKANILSVLDNVAQASISSNITLQSNDDDGGTISSAEKFQTILQSYGNSIGQQLVPSQDDVIAVKDSFRLVISAPASTDGSTSRRRLNNAEKSFSLQLPRSATEQFLNLPVPEVSLPLPSASESDDSSGFYYQVHQLALPLLTSSLNETKFSGAFDSVTLSMPSTPCSKSSGGCTIEMVFPITKNKTQIDSQTVDVVSAQCDEGQIENIPVTCPNGDTTWIKCNGTAAVININCPVQIEEPKCGIAEDVEGMVCTPIGEDEFTFTCSCTLPASSDSNRRRTTSSRWLLTTSNSTNVDSTISVSYVAMMTTTMSTFTSTVISAQGLDASVLTKGWQVIATLGSFMAFIGVALITAHLIDLGEKVDTHHHHHHHHGHHHGHHDQHHAQEGTENSTTEPQQSQSRLLQFVTAVKLWKNKVHASSAARLQKFHKHQHKIHHFGSSMLAVAEDALPRILSGKSLSTKVKEEMKRHHRWLAIIFLYSKRFPRMLRVLSLSTNIVIMLFVQSITYNLSHGDDGTCASFSTEQQCLAEPSAFDKYSSKCYWLADDESCQYIQPDNDVKVVIFIAILSAVLSTPFAVATDWMIQTVLAAPTLHVNSFNEGNAVGDNKIGNAVGVVPSASSIATGQPMFRRRIGRLQSSFFFNHNDEHLNKAISKAQSEFIEMMNGLQGYRQVISDSERKEIDQLWGLDDKGEFIDKDMKKSIEHESTGHRKSLVPKQFFQKVYHDRKTQAYIPIADRIKLDIQHVIVTTEKELERFDAQELSDKDKSKRILFYFQKDLMAGLSGQVLESHDRREEITQKPYSQELKYACWVLLFIMNFGMLFYIFLFGVSRDTHHQAAWAKSFAMWLVMEIIMVSSVTVLVMNVFVPSLLMKDVKKIKMKLIDTIVQYNKKLHSATTNDFGHEGKDNADGDMSVELVKSPLDFNAAQYLFVSYRLAKKYPELRVSKIIAAYQTPWPRQSYLHVSKEVTKSYSKKFASINRAATLVIAYFITNFLTFPVHLQDMFMQIASTVVLGYTILAHLQLYQIYPVLVAIPTIIAAAIVHFIVKSSQSHSKIEMMKLLGVTNKDSNQVEEDLKKNESGPGKLSQVVPVQVNQDQLHSEDDDDGPLHHAQLQNLTSHRRQSIQVGLGLLKKGKQEHESENDGDSSEDEGGVMIRPCPAIKEDQDIDLESCSSGKHSSHGHPDSESDGEGSASRSESDDEHRTGSLKSRSLSHHSHSESLQSFKSFGDE